MSDLEKDRVGLFGERADNNYMREFKFDFGTGVTANGEPLSAETVNAGIKALMLLASELAGGASLIARNGCWIDGGKLIEEPGFTLVVLADYDCCSVALVDEIKVRFQQKSVFVTETFVNAQLR